MLSTVVAKVNGAVYGLLERVGIMKTHEINAPANIKAFILMVRRCEGTSGKDGYRTLFGGSLFTSYADHPRKKITKNGYTSTAAGAGQFLASTWDEIAKQEGLKDFSPPSQDVGFINRFRKRNAFDDILSGRIKAAIEKCSYEWASLPPSRYGQPNRTLSECLQFYKDYGGKIS